MEVYSCWRLNIHCLVLPYILTCKMVDIFNFFYVFCGCCWLPITLPQRAEAQHVTTWQHVHVCMYWQVEVYMYTCVLSAVFVQLLLVCQHHCMYGCWAFLPSAWDSLLDPVHHWSATFRRLLKTFMFSLYWRIECIRGMGYMNNALCK